MSSLFIGLISGTSVDGIDAVLAEFTEAKCHLRDALTVEFSAPLRERIEALINATQLTWQQLGTLDIELGEAFAAAALQLLERNSLIATDIAAIGHHGQTVHHAPLAQRPFTIQLGDPNTVAARTGIATVADLRRYDMAVGGQGAPMVPAFHDWLLRHATERRVIVNIGGIANITTLLPGEPILGLDTGPGNTLLDYWTATHRGERFDAGGNWSAQGEVSQSLLDALMLEPWFALSGPKSTGREQFHRNWLETRGGSALRKTKPVDVQATLAELTAATIADAIALAAPACERVIVCGGGAHNPDLLNRLQRRCGCRTESVQAHGVAPDWIEGLAFAWLARARLLEQPGNVPSVTGAHQPVILGGLYSGKPVA